MLWLEKTAERKGFKTACCSLWAAQFRHTHTRAYVERKKSLHVHSHAETSTECFSLPKPSDLDAITQG